MTNATKPTNEVDDVLASIRRLVADQSSSRAEEDQPIEAPSEPSAEVRATDSSEALVLGPDSRVQEEAPGKAVFSRSATRDHPTRDEGKPAEAEANESVPKTTDASQSPAEEPAGPEAPKSAVPADKLEGDNAPSDQATDPSNEAQNPTETPEAKDATSSETAESGVDPQEQSSASGTTGGGGDQGSKSGEQTADQPSKAQAPLGAAKPVETATAQARVTYKRSRRDDAPAQARPAATPAPAARARAESGDDEDDFLDEETLREIIADVVREELQGVLGQRITRNVRKMVRREIRMVLAAEQMSS